MESKNKTICVVGSGISGIHIANLLFNHDFNIIHFEANNKIGGRIQDGQFLNKKINLGAELIHGKNSDFYRNVNKTGTKLLNISSKESYFYYKGIFENSDILRNKFPEFKKTYDFCYDMINNGKILNENISIREYINKNFDEKTHFIVEGMIGAELSADINNLSLSDLSSILYKWSSGMDDFLCLNNTQYELLEMIYGNYLSKNKEKLFLNTQIWKIEYVDEKVKLYDKNENIYECDMCIISIPITQYKNIEFNPKLSKDKQSSIEKINMDSSGKIFLKFKFDFITSYYINQMDCSSNTKFEMEFFGIDIGDIFLPGLVNQYWKNYYENDEEGIFLTGLVSSSNCKKLSKLYNENKEMFLKEILSPFDKTFCINSAEILEGYEWKDWSLHPFVEGGYSSISINEDNSREILFKPIDEKIFFVGEVFGKNGHNGTIHGSIESSNEVYKNIKKILKIKK